MDFTQGVFMGSFRMNIFDWTLPGSSIALKIKFNEGLPNEEHCRVIQQGAENDQLLLMPEKASQTESVK